MTPYRSAWLPTALLVGAIYCLIGRVIALPFYASDPLILGGLALWLESSMAALCALIPIALVMIRLELEERFLRRELPGYNEYASRVRHRLIPRVW